MIFSIQIVFSEIIWQCIKLYFSKKLVYQVAINWNQAIHTTSKEAPSDFSKVYKMISVRKVVAPWCSDYHYCITSFNKAWTQVLHMFKCCSWRVRDLQCWRFLAMVPAGNKAKRLSSVNHTTKTIYHLHHYDQRKHEPNRVKLGNVSINRGYDHRMFRALMVPCNSNFWPPSPLSSLIYINTRTTYDHTNFYGDPSIFTDEDACKVEQSSTKKLFLLSLFWKESNQTPIKKGVRH